ncbi:exportin-2 [Danaus plexippus]|uniref:Exportin-2 n=1 Tax=Danaus plexippus plexippus TaxID=278856 RepID=A0A212F558_DANPL|nr:exportin-2 [Danaus plexippus]OWR48872.1 putative importin [Danaus plexippus plexippus]
MEVTEDNLSTLATYLQQTLNPDPNIRRPAEKFLEGVEVNQNYAILLLHLIDKDTADPTIRVAAAVTFKNYIKRNWPVEEDGVDRIHASDRATIKTLIVSLMLKSPEAIQRQFSDAVSIIGKSDFPEKWPGLISEMVEKFATGDFHVINGVLRTAHSLFKRYRYEFKSQKLWEEIKHVLENIAKPLTDLFVVTIDLTNKHAGNAQALKVIYGSLVLICKVFYSLNYQDLPEFFEDNMPIWMPNLLNLLQVTVPCLADDEDDKPGVIECLRTEVCECASLYALKYEEEFAPHAPGFVTAVWHVLLHTGAKEKYDSLVSNALTFLAKVAEKNSYKNLFEDPATLSQICEKVVIPNMEFRESDIELFEDNPEEYVRRDIEGSDVETRRRAACDLVRALATHYEDKMMAIFGQYVEMMLSKYSSSGGTAWINKDTALFLVTSLASRGSTQAAGVTRASPLVDLTSFAATHVLPELQRPDVNELPVLKADAIKYIITFRSLLPKDLIASALPLLIQHIRGGGVVCTYASCAVEKLLAGGLATKTQLEPYAGNLMGALLTAIDGGPTAHNEYVMKALLRTLASLREAALPYLGEALPKLASILSLVAKNPSKPHFNHYLFESLSLAVSLVVKANPSAITAFEDALFPIFQDILQNDVLEFMPYVFQMLSLLLELRGSCSGAGDGGGDTYAALLPCLVAPPLWERPANVRPLVRLLCAFVAVRSDLVLSSGKLNAMLGVFQKLIASKTNDHEGFFLIQTMLFKFGESVMQQYTKQIITLLFQRLSSSKTTKYVRGLIAFLGFYSAHFGADPLIELVDSVQANMFAMYVERVLVPDVQKVSGALERKAAAVGCVKLLCHSAHFREGRLAGLWTNLLQALIALFELPPDETQLPDDHFIEVDDTPGYQPVYAQLACAKTGSDDPLAAIEDPKRYLAESLAAMSRDFPGVLPPRVGSLDEPHRGVLQNYLQSYGVAIC